MSILEPDIEIPCTCRYPNTLEHFSIGFCWWCHFGQHVIELAEEFKKMWAKHRYGYQTASVEHMLLRLNDELEEISTTENYDELHDEVLDVVNIGMMLLELIRKKKIESQLETIRKRKPAAPNHSAHSIDEDQQGSGSGSITIIKHLLNMFKGIRKKGKLV